MSSDGRFQKTIKLQTRRKGSVSFSPFSCCFPQRTYRLFLPCSCHLITDEIVDGLGSALKDVKVRICSLLGCLPSPTLFLSPRILVPRPTLLHRLLPPFSPRVSTPLHSHDVSRTYLPSLSQIGILFLFLQHTSAALSLNENCDPTVRTDLDMALDTIVPESLPWEHVDEGPDDSVSHTKSSIIGVNVQIPITNGRLALGTWQGAYLCVPSTYSTFLLDRPKY